jgi:hypothetical protein
MFVNLDLFLNRKLLKTNVMTIFESLSAMIFKNINIKKQCPYDFYIFGSCVYFKPKTAYVKMLSERPKVITK